ncbi:MAG: glycosyl hydrolase family 18 protein [Bacilli bacterium]
MRKSFKKALSIGLCAMLLGSLSPSLFANAATKASSSQETNINGIPVPSDYYERKIVGYFASWDYQYENKGNSLVTDLPWDKLTHINYAFGKVNEQTNKLEFGDMKAATQETFAGLSIDYRGTPVAFDPTLPYKGHMNLLSVMKKKFPNVKVMLSVGGWADSRGFYTMLDTDQGIDTFTTSAVEYLRKYNIDGIDIDFEYPSSTAGAGNPQDFDLSDKRRNQLPERYNVFMKALRAKLDAAAKQDGKYYLVTAALSGSSWVLGGQGLGEYAKYLDYASVMSYDYHGGWNEFVENQANIYPDAADNETKNMAMPTLNFDWSYRYYRGVLPPEKILMGIPYYTRGWTNVQGGTNGLHGTSKTPAIGNENIWGDTLNGKEVPAGANPLWHVKNLLKNDTNYKRLWDDVGKVPFVWNEKNRSFLTFEDEQSITERAKYIANKNVGGAIIWVMNGDYDYDATSGKYTVGDTLTSKLAEEFAKIGPAKKTVETPTAEPWDFDVAFAGKYDHPNFVYTMKIKNNTGQDLKDWTISFDIPKSAKFGSSWDGVATLKDNGDFTTVSIKGPGWQSFTNGSTVSMQGSIVLAFTGPRNFMLNGHPMKSVVGDVKPPEKQLLAGSLTTSTLNSTDGAFQIKGSVPENNTATSYQLLENGKAVATKTLDPNRTAPVAFTFDASGKADGTYTYVLETLAGNLVKQSNSISVLVKKGVVLPLVAGTVSASATTSTDGNYTVTATAPKNNAATSYQLYEDNTVIASGALTANASTDTLISKAITNKVNGTYSYKLVLSDASNKTATSSVTTVKVERSVVVNNAPTLSGVADQSLTVGDSFNAKGNVTASDKEDGDLTSKIVISSNVDTSKAGVYTVTYTVTDNGGLKATASATVTVKAKETTGDNWDANKVYLNGDIVIYKGEKYTAKWWNKNEAPDKSQAWKKAEVVSPDGTKVYAPGSVYVSGDVVSYNGKKYRAKWWTQSAPGSDDSWVVVG